MCFSYHYKYGSYKNYICCSLYKFIYEWRCVKPHVKIHFIIGIVFMLFIEITWLLWAKDYLWYISQIWHDKSKKSYACSAIDWEIRIKYIANEWYHLSNQYTIRLLWLQQPACNLKAVERKVLSYASIIMSMIINVNFISVKIYLKFLFKVVVLCRVMYIKNSILTMNVTLIYISYIFMHTHIIRESKYVWVR